VRRPGHVLYYRTVAPGLIVIVRVLHERVEPSRHLSEISEDQYLEYGVASADPKPSTLRGRRRLTLNV